MSFKEYILTLLLGFVLGFLVCVPIILKHNFSVIDDNTSVLRIEVLDEKSKCKNYFDYSENYILSDCSKYKVGDKVFN